MEPLYPQNILERKYPILREQREKAERDAVEEKRHEANSITKLMAVYEPDLYANAPLGKGSIGLKLNTLA